MSQASCNADQKLLIAKAYALWNELEAYYPGRWIKSSGNVLVDDGRGNRVLSVTADKWARAVSRFDDADVVKGMEFVCVTREGRQFLPALGELLSSCKSFERVRIRRQRLRLPERPHVALSTPEGLVSKNEALRDAWRSLGVDLDKAN